jgi:hypothetical protein
MAASGVRVGCFRPPSVPDGISRLRLTARADLSESDLDQAVAALAALAELPGLPALAAPAGMPAPPALRRQAARTS